MTRFSRGDVVLRGDSVGIVWRMVRNALVILPIVRIVDGSPWHRSDYELADWKTLAAIGMGGDLAVKVSLARRVTACFQTKVCTCPLELIEALVTVCEREMDEQAIERKWAAWGAGKKVMEQCYYLH